MDIDPTPWPSPLPFSLPLILDGATGTHMQEAGMPPGACPEAWILEHPEAIVRLQRAYIAAGSTAVTAPTFGAHREKLGTYGLGHEVERFNRELVALSREVAGARPVAGDIAPTGLYIEPFGEASFESIVDIYKEQMAALDAAGVDFFLVETTTTLFEARAAVLAGQAVSKKPIVVSFSCDEHGRCLSGADMLCALITMQGMGVSAFGMNCACSPEDLIPHVHRIAPFARVPLLIQPNAGLPSQHEGRVTYPMTPEQFSALVPVFWAYGVRLFGGCCGTGPAHIAALREALGRLDMASGEEVAAAAQELFPCATNREAIFIAPDIEVGDPIVCSPELAEDIINAEDQPHGAMKILLTDDEDPDILAENQYLMNKPLCLSSHDPDLMERALRLYHGRAFYDNTAQLPEESLKRWARQYGLVCF